MRWRDKGAADFHDAISSDVIASIHRQKIACAPSNSRRSLEDSDVESSGHERVRRCHAGVACSNNYNIVLGWDAMDGRGQEEREKGGTTTS